MTNRVLITGGEQGLGSAILDEIKPDTYWNINGSSIVSTAKKGNLKQFVDAVIDGIEGEIPNVVINNFSINHLSWIGQTEKADSLIMETNVMLPYWVINALVRRGAVCRVVNIGSMTYKVAQRTTTLYCASKAASVHMTKVMARELAPKGWVLNNFTPGKILGTDMSRKTDEQVVELRGWSKEEADRYSTSMVPMGRFMSVKEAAKIVAKILEMPDYVNGATIDAFGGLS